VIAVAAPVASLAGDLFDLGVSPEEKVLRSLLVFAFLLVALRLGGSASWRRSTCST
jgi:hypothetical protein